MLAKSTYTLFLKNYLKIFFKTTPLPIIDRIKAENTIIILLDISIKKPCGTIFIKLSVAGSSIHKSLLKKIWWKIIKPEWKEIIKEYQKKLDKIFFKISGNKKYQNGSYGQSN